MDIEQQLKSKIELTDKYLYEGSVSLNKIAANQIAIMEYLQHLGKVVEQNTVQLEYLVERVTDIEEGMQDLLGCDVVVVEQEMKENERIVTGD